MEVAHAPLLFIGGYLCWGPRKCSVQSLPDLSLPFATPSLPHRGELPRARLCLTFQVHVCWLMAWLSPCPYLTLGHWRVDFASYNFVFWKLPWWVHSVWKGKWSSVFFWLGMHDWISLNLATWTFTIVTFSCFLEWWAQLVMVSSWWTLLHRTWRQE